MRVAVAGATGSVGSLVVVAAEARGHEVVLLSRAHGTDLVLDRGLDDRLRGVDVVVDVVNTTSTSARASTRFFGATTSSLLRAGSAAGVTHHVALSIVGIDEVRGGYYAGKVAQEAMLVEAGTAWSVLRSTQLHEFVPRVLGTAPPGPVALVPRGRVRPVAAVEVAAALVDAVESGPRGRLPDLAGPREEELSDLARRYLRASGSGRRVVPVRLPGSFFTSLRDGSLLPGDGCEVASTSFEEWLGSTSRW